MRKIWAIASKELYQTLTDRNFLLIMFATPLALSTIIGLAFGGIGSDTPTIAKIPVAVVNLDQGIDLGGLGATNALSPTQPLSATAAMTGVGNNFSLNVGNVIADVLLATPITSSTVLSTSAAPFDPSALTCDLVADEADTPSTFQGSLDDLLTTTPLTDPATARQGVEQGDYAVAVIIPAAFSQRFLPTFGETATAEAAEAANAVEVYGNSGRTISSTIVRGIVEAIVNQFLQVTVTLEASIDTLLDNPNLAQLNALSLLSTSPSAENAEALGVIGCLFQPGINPVSLQQQPLNALQESNRFAILLVAVGSAQAVFFALFTGVFGILSIYEEQKQGTLQRMLVSPTTGTTILLGKLAGNVLTVFAQLLLLLLALTLIASAVLGTPTFIWGSNVVALVAVLLVLSICVSGVGVLIVGLARIPEQAQLIGPLVNIGLGVLGGALGFSLGPAVARFSLIYWGVDAFEKLAAHQAGAIGPNLLVLAGQGLCFFLIGSWFFRRRLNL